MISFELTIKNIPKIESKTMIGYSNLSNLLSRINFFDEFRTKRLEISIKILKKFENGSLVKLSRNIFSSLFELLNIIAIVNIIINEVRLNIKLKLFFVKTPTIKIKKIDKVKKISGNKIFKLLIILVYPGILNSNFIIIN
jgi:hypothetical protein